MMNVRLAAKVLSRSVRLVLQKYGADESRNSQVYFVHGQVFDCLNSRSFEEAAQPENLIFFHTKTEKSHGSSFG